MNDLVNNRDAGYLRRHRAHYDVTVLLQGSSLVLGRWWLYFTTAPMKQPWKIRKMNHINSLTTLIHITDKKTKHSKPFAYFMGYCSWWRNQMETFSAQLAICAGNSPVPCEFPAQRPVTRSCGVFFDLRLNKRLSKQSGDWWLEMLSRPLWPHCNVFIGMICTNRWVSARKT